MLMTQSFNTIQNRPNTIQKTVTELCIDKTNNISFLESDVRMIDFDTLAKEVGSTIHSPDGLALSKQEEIHFIEFKNMKWGNVKVQNCLNKIYDGISVFGLFAGNETTFNKFRVIVTVICNPEKNGINVEQTRRENPVFDALVTNIEKSGFSNLSDQDASKYKKMVDGKLSSMRELLRGLCSYGIDVEVNALLIKEEIDSFLLNFSVSE